MIDSSHTLAFTMLLTVNADEHPLMKRFHKPGVENRSVVIVPPTGYAAWVSCKSTDEARSFLQLRPVEALHPPRKPAPRPSEDDQPSSL